MRIPYIVVPLSLLLAAGACAAPPYLVEQIAQAQAKNHPLLVYQIRTEFLSNFSPQGAYTRIRFINTGTQPLTAVAFEVVPYSQGSPVLHDVKHPVLFGATGKFKVGQHYAVLSAKPVWAGSWGRVDCVHLVGLVYQYADGQTEKIGRGQIEEYMSAHLLPQNCTNPSVPGPHN